MPPLTPTAQPQKPCPLLLDRYNSRLKIFGVTSEHFLQDPPSWAARGALEIPDAVTKVILYATQRIDHLLKPFGFAFEASIVGYYASGCDAYLYARYDDAERATEPNFAELQRMVGEVSARGVCRDRPDLPDITTRIATAEDAERVAGLLQSCFDDYPTPLDPAHIRGLIEQGSSHFRLALDAHGQALACASLECEPGRSSAELTDCATLPSVRGKGLLSRLMLELEDDAQQRLNLSDLFTIARATQASVNRAFAKLGYGFTGCLIRNCRMPQGWESMNVWCRHLDASA